MKTETQDCEREHVCEDGSRCVILEDERERAVESLRAHLSEQRHDFFNLLQVLYGYTQLKKADKVLSSISNYCKEMENIGRLYNCKCIKLADLLYTKGKEAESVDMKLSVSVDVNFDPVIRILDDEAVLHAIEHAISSYLYILDKSDCKYLNIIYELKENEEDFRMEIYCREIREGKLGPVSFEMPEQVFYWKKIAKSVMGFDMVAKHCSYNCFDGRMLDDGTTFVLSIHKPKQQC
jgi:hypothetical protein